MSDNDHVGVQPGIQRLDAMKWQGVGAPVDGDTLVGVIPVGGEYVDSETGMHYYNSGEAGGTLAAPVFSLVIT